MTTPEAALRAVLQSAMPRLEAIADTEAARPRAPGKWSRKEILGHLIDSASNNHQRFVRAQLADDLICPTYDQDAWVSMQRYNESAWSDLVSLWLHFNLHLAHVMESCTTEARTRPRTRHNLDKVAFRPVSSNQPATLDYFMSDYVAHLEHHLGQLFERRVTG